eukprot:3724389-Rhodomonas_salina.1
MSECEEGVARVNTPGAVSRGERGRMPRDANGDPILPDAPLLAAFRFDAATWYQASMWKKGLEFLAFYSFKPHKLLCLRTQQAPDIQAQCAAAWLDVGR